MAEMCVDGEEPYKDMSTRAVIFALEKGQRMTQDELGCSNEMYTLLTSCWDVNPSRRPTFLVLCRRLERLIRSSNALGLVAGDTREDLGPNFGALLDSDTNGGDAQPAPSSSYVSNFGVTQGVATAPDQTSRPAPSYEYNCDPRLTAPGADAATADHPTITAAGPHEHAVGAQNIQERATAGGRGTQGDAQLSLNGLPAVTRPDSDDASPTYDRPPCKPMQR